MELQIALLTLPGHQKSTIASGEIAGPAKAEVRLGLMVVLGRLEFDGKEAARVITPDDFQVPPLAPAKRSRRVLFQW
ncbi:hypothetical protein [Tardiphaga sp. 813_E8_N1_3]|uniref:hypothetical protein n=1 Tax=Tardiphaga sp. 813_E8_N1_3 TaxID=3240760 RepID=UPI003F1ED93D